jgi:putative oxidoreductase
MKAVKKTIVTDIISALFILLFVYTATTKLIEHESFRAVLSQSPLIGIKANTLSWVLPVLELITATLLFVPSFRKWGFASSFILMLLFTWYISYMILFARNLPCSCGGIFSAMTWPEHLIFNILFTALAAIGLWFTYGNKLFIAINRTSRTPVKNSRQNS